MENIKVVNIEPETLTFNDGTQLVSSHRTECCEHHYIDFSDLDITELEDLEFDLTKDSFFNRITGYGIEMLPKNGYPVRIPGYGSNNGYYSSEINLLVLTANDEVLKSYDVSACQVIDSNN